MGGYRIAQICMNGHCITDSADAYPEFRANACSKCGAKTITECPNCGTNIRGYYDSGGISIREYIVPLYCHECGSPYPWTEAKLEAMHELIQEDENTSEEEKERLIEVLPALVVDTPQTKLAETRMKKFFAKAGSFVVEGMRSIIVDVASETIKKSMGL